jgi:hypothetical protein
MPAIDPCPGGTRYWACDYSGGTYDPETKTLSGKCKSAVGHQLYLFTAEEEDEPAECKLIPSDSEGSISWQATWEDRVVKGSHGGVPVRADGAGPVRDSPKRLKREKQSLACLIGYPFSAGAI